MFLYQFLTKYLHQAVFFCVLKLFLDLTDLKSRYDEEKSLREAADQRLTKMTEQLQTEKQENEKLQTELVHQLILH